VAPPQIAFVFAILYLVELSSVPDQNQLQGLELRLLANACEENEPLYWHPHILNGKKVLKLTIKGLTE